MRANYAALKCNIYQNAKLNANLFSAEILTALFRAHAGMKSQKYDESAGDLVKISLTSGNAGSLRHPIVSTFS